MIEIFLSNQNTYYETFICKNGKVKYSIKEKNYKNSIKYEGLTQPSIIIDGIILDKDNATYEQLKSIKNFMHLIYNKVENYKKYYNPITVKYIPNEIFALPKTIEVPSRHQFNEWVYITAFNYLNNFYKYIRNKKQAKAKRRLQKIFK